MKLSVIIPCLVRDEKVERAIRSLGRAPDGLELEVVVVEGERPLGRARNVGLERATGDYIAWLDGDDEVVPEWGVTIARALAAHSGCDVLVMDMEMVGWPGCKGSAWKVTPGTADPRRLLTDVARDMRIFSNTVLFVTRRGLWTGLRFTEDTRIGEDYMMALPLLSRAKSCVYLGRSLYRYHCTAGGLMMNEAAHETKERVLIMERRLAGAPQTCRRSAAWGMGVGCYWLAEAAALGKRPSENADYGRRWIRRQFGVLLAEAVCGRWLSVRDRVGWMVRFACAATNCWWIQRRRHGGRR